MMKNLNDKAFVEQRLTFSECLLCAKNLTCLTFQRGGYYYIFHFMHRETDSEYLINAQGNIASNW